MGEFESLLTRLEKSQPVALAVGDTYSCVESVSPRLQKVAARTQDLQRRMAVQELLIKAHDRTASFSGLTDASRGLLKELFEVVHEESNWKTR